MEGEQVSVSLSLPAVIIGASVLVQCIVTSCKLCKGWSEYEQRWYGTTTSTWSCV